jgi:hypothetical protein
MAPKCSPPKSQTVKSHWRAAPRQHRHGPRKGSTYYVAESSSGHTCGHHHKTRTAAMQCAIRQNKRETRTRGRKYATFTSDKRTAG